MLRNLDMIIELENNSELKYNELIIHHSHLLCLDEIRDIHSRELFRKKFDEMIELHFLVKNSIEKIWLWYQKNKLKKKITARIVLRNYFPIEIIEKILC